MLSIQLFGSPQLIRDGRPLVVNRRKSRALLYYIAAQNAPVSRDHLLAFFWPDHERAVAQPILRTTIYGLKKVLAEALLAEDNAIALAEAVDVDAIRFEQQLGQPAVDIPGLTATLDLYQGEFLADVILPDAPNFEDWIAAERERYRRMAVRGLAVLSRLHEAQPDYRAALAALERALTFDPFQEDLQRACLRLHYLAGDRAGAIRRYEKLRQLLDEEMGVPPMAETRALYDAIITDTFAPTPVPAKPSVVQNCPEPQPPAELPFIGREAELARLFRAAGAHKLALLEGEAGIGKTRLMDEFVRAAVTAKSEPFFEQTPLVLIGQARELEHALPYHPLIEALRGLVNDPVWPGLRVQLDLAPIWLKEAARLLPELSTAAPVPAVESSIQPADESRLWEAVSQLLQAVARHRPLILALDDLHWADSATLGLLGYLLRQTAAANLPVFFIATTRPAQPRSPLAVLSEALVREKRVERLTLQRLSSADISTLTQRLIAGTNNVNNVHNEGSDALVDWLTRTSEGNPFVLAELINHARENGILNDDGRFNSAALPDSPAVPQSVYTLIQTRLARLSETAQRVLNAAVAMGREFEFEVVARAAALSDSAALDALDELRAARLVSPLDDGLRYRFDHNLTMEVAWREVGEPRHRLLHRRVAEALESLYRDRLDSLAGLLAQHFSEGNAPDRAARYAFQAGQRAAGLAAWAEAIAFYEQALTGLTGDEAESDRRAVLSALGLAQIQSGSFAQASESYRAALNLAYRLKDRVAAREAQTGLAQSLLIQARYTEVIALVQPACGSSDPISIINAEYMWGLALSQEGRDLVEAGNHLRRAMALLKEHYPAENEAGPVSNGVAGATQLNFELGNVLAQQGDLVGAIGAYRSVLEATEPTSEGPTINMHILAHNNLAYHLHLLHDPTAAGHARMALALAEEQGLIGMMPFLYSTLGELALAQHDLPTAEARFNQGLDLARRFNALERVAGLTANLGLVAAERGQTPLAIHYLSTALTQTDALGIRHLATRIRIWLAPLLPPTEARALLTEAHTLAESSGHQRLLDEIKALEAKLSALEA